MHHFCTSFNF